MRFRVKEREGWGGGGEDISMFCHAAAIKRDAVPFFFFNQSEKKGYF